MINLFEIKLEPADIKPIGTCFIDDSLKKISKQKFIRKFLEVKKLFIFFTYDVQEKILVAKQKIIYSFFNIIFFLMLIWRMSIKQ